MILPYLFRQSLLSISMQILALGIIVKILFAFTMKVPSPQELDVVKGVIVEVRLGGDGRSTTLYVASDGRTKKYKSYLGKVWPGMEALRKGDPVKIWAEQDILYMSIFTRQGTSWIWHLSKGETTIVRYEDIKPLRVKNRVAFDNIANSIIALGTGLTLFAYMRRRRLRLALI